MATKASPLPIYVQPAMPTPHEVIPLTGGSVMAGLNTLTSSHVLVFEPPQGEAAGGGRPSDVVRRGLSRVLVPYYPLAGRIVERDDGWEVQCEGQGAVFIVTTAPDFEEVHVVGSQPAVVGIPPFEQVRLEASLPAAPAPPALPPPTTAPRPALVVQVDELENKGFILSIRLCEGICDAAGLVHFLCGWAEMARGKPHVSVMPMWGGDKGDMFNDPFTSTASHATNITTTRPQDLFFFGHDTDDDHTRLKVHLPNLGNRMEDNGFSSTLPCHRHAKAYKAPITKKVKVDIPYGVIKALLDWILVKDGHACTPLQVLVAHVWRERTRALQVPSNLETRLFFVSQAQREHPLGFYGSFPFNCQAKARASDLLDLPLVYAVQLIQKAEENLASNFSTCTNDFKQVHCSCGFVPLEVLLFTTLPTIANTENRLDFGALGQPLSSPLDNIHFPPNINIAALAPPSHTHESVLHIIMNNIPFVHLNELCSFLCTVPHHALGDSKI